VYRSLIVATAVAPAAGAAALSLPVQVIIILAATELIALMIVRVSQIYLQRELRKGVVEVLRATSNPTSVTNQVDGGLDVRCDPTLRAQGDLGIRP
jgi:predicted RecB family endonuclease